MLRRFKASMVRFAHRQFVRNVFIVVSGTAIAQATTMAFSPVLTRLYGPEAFGLLGVFSSVLAILVPLAGLTYPLAIVLPESDDDAKKVGYLSAYIAIAVSILFFSTLSVGKDRILSAVNAQGLGDLAFVLPVTVLFTSFSQILQQFIIRKKQFSITARVTIFHTFFLNLCKVIVGFSYPVGGALVIIATLGNFVNSFLLFLGVKSINSYNCCYKSKSKKNIKEKSLWEIAQRHYDFPLYRAPQVFINAASQSIPLLMLSALFGTATAGGYALCRSVLSMPTQLISGSVGDVFYPRIVEAQQKGERLDILVLKATLWLGLIGIIPFGTVIALGPWLFSFIFGSNWTNAGVFARWLAIMIFFFFINKPSVVAAPVINRQRGLFVYELFSTGIKIISIYIGAVIFNDSVTTVALFSISGAISYIFLIVWIIMSCHDYNKNEREPSDASKTS